MTAPNRLLYGAGILLLVAGLAITAGPLGSLSGGFGPSGPNELGGDAADQERTDGGEMGTPASPPADGGSATGEEDEPETPRETSQYPGDGESGEGDGIEVGVDLL